MQLTKEMAEKWLNDRIRKHIELQKHSRLCFGEFDSDNSEWEYSFEECGVADMRSTRFNVPGIQIYADTKSFLKFAEVLGAEVKSGRMAKNLGGTYTIQEKAMHSFWYKGVEFHAYIDEGLEEG